MYVMQHTNYKLQIHWVHARVEGALIATRDHIYVQKCQC
jgi:hypothetical protein